MSVHQLEPSLSQTDSLGPEEWVSKFRTFTSVTLVGENPGKL